MPLVNEAKLGNELKKQRRPPKRAKKWLYWLAIAFGVLVVAIGGYKVYEAINNSQISAQASANQKADQNKKRHVAEHSDKLDNKDISFDQNSDIPDAKTLQKYRSLPDKLSFDGYVAVPKQSGVSTPINTLQINEGASNKVLAYGAGTLKPNQVMGQGNYSIAAHNFGFGSGRFGFSPMQRAIDVNSEPRAYLSDGKNIYVYQFNKESDKLPGRKSIPYLKGGGVTADSLATDKAVLTMVTCDEPGVWNNSPKNRIVMTAHLIRTIDWNYATDSERNLFPGFK